MSENKYHHIHQCLFLGCNFITKDLKTFSKHLDTHDIFERLVEKNPPPKQNEKVTKYSNTLLEALDQGKLNFLAVENPDS